MTDDIKEIELLDATTEIVSAFVSKNSISKTQLPDLMASVHSTLLKMVSGDPAPEQLEPAVPIKKSVTPDYIVCLEDGAKLKMLKRYLRTRHNLTPDEYRKRWGLPSDYPMTAPEYAKRRSALAKKIGLGKKQL